MFGIWTTVSGGVTGNRAAWLKGGDGQPYRFASRDAAEAFRAGLHTNLRGGTTPSGRPIAFQTFEAREIESCAR